MVVIIYATSDIRDCFEDNKTFGIRLRPTCRICRLRNPWGEGEVTLYRDGKKYENLRGSLLRFPTRKGERVVLVASGDTPQAHRRVLL
jgi:hypothetical protein